MACKTVLSLAYPWLKAPFIVSAPMKVSAGARLAVAVSRAGGLGFIGCRANPQEMHDELQVAKGLIDSEPTLRAASSSPSSPIPVGVGFLTWADDIEIAASAVEKYRPCAAWLFAPRNGQAELNEWSRRLRAASKETKIWIQVGTLREAIEAAGADGDASASFPSAAPDVLVVQGAEAGGHGRAVDGIGVITLLPEIKDALASRGRGDMPLFAAGGIADGRGVAATLSLGAAGAVMGTRFLASDEALISKGYKDEVVRASDGGASTTRTLLYNHLKGIYGWPEPFSPRTVINKGWYDEQAGVAFEELKKLHDEDANRGDEAWGPEGRAATYAGAGIGLVRGVDGASAITHQVREDSKKVARGIQDLFEDD